MLTSASFTVNLKWTWFWYSLHVPSTSSMQARTGSIPINLMVGKPVKKRWKLFNACLPLDIDRGGHIFLEHMNLKNKLMSRLLFFTCCTYKGSFKEMVRILNHYNFCYMQDIKIYQSPKLILKSGPVYFIDKHR